jgi:prepilin-type N-terminal cleavage/methylation domain-containing protein
MVGHRRRSAPGFTVIELMIALVVIGVMAATVAPSLSEVLADNRQTSAAMDVVRLARQTRARTTATGTAHLLRYLGDTGEAAAFGLGTIAVHVGMNSKCMQTPWAQSTAPVVGARQGPREIFHMSEYNPTSSTREPSAADDGRHVIALAARFGTEAAAVQTETCICYQPNGDIYTGTSVGALVIQTQPVLITIARSMDGAARGRDRQVLFPVGGHARLR